MFSKQELVRENHRDQVFGVVALKRRGHFFAGAVAGHGERGIGHPAPAGGEHGRRQQRLDQHVPDRGGLQITGRFCQWKTVGRAQRQYDIVFTGRGLQFEIETAAETLAQCQSPGAVDPRAVGRMDDQVHVAGFIEKAFENDFPEAGKRGQRGLGGRQVIVQLVGRCRRQVEFLQEKVFAGIASLFQQGVQPDRQVGHCL